MKNNNFDLVMKYLNNRDNERASFMYVLTEGLSWDKKDISRIYDFDVERLDIDSMENYLGWASSGECKCIKLSTVLFNGGARFNSDELKLDDLLSGLDSKHLSACLDAMEIRYGNPSRIIEKKINVQHQKRSSQER